MRDILSFVGFSKKSTQCVKMLMAKTNANNQPQHTKKLSCRPIQAFASLPFFQQSFNAMGSCVWTGKLK